MGHAWLVCADPGAGNCADTDLAAAGRALITSAPPSALSARALLGATVVSLACDGYNPVGR